MAETISDSFLMAVQAGLVPGHRIIEKFGHAEEVGTTIADIWDASGLYGFRTAAIIMTLSSASTNDTSAGSGARTVRIFGLNESYNEIEETVILNGQTAVATKNAYLRITRMKVITAGATGYNEGNVYLGTGTVTTGEPDVIDAQISFTAAGLGENQTLMAIYTIPAGHTGLLINPHFTNPQAKTAECWIKVRPFGTDSPFQTKLRDMVYQGSLRINSNKVIAKILEKGDIRMSAVTPSVATDMAAGFQVLLIDNSYVKGIVNG